MGLFLNTLFFYIPTWLCISCSRLSKINIFNNPPASGSSPSTFNSKFSDSFTPTLCSLAFLPPPSTLCSLASLPPPSTPCSLAPLFPPSTLCSLASFPPPTTLWSPASLPPLSTPCSLASLLPHIVYAMFSSSSAFTI